MLESTSDERTGLFEEGTKVMTTHQPVPAVRATVLGYPRIGPDRELKRAVEAYWSGRIAAAALASTGADLRARTWRQLADAGLDEVPAGTFSFYDHMLDMAVLFGVAPTSAQSVPVQPGSTEWFDRYFTLARGSADAPAWEMTKWFDTNYHYIVPPIGPETHLRVADDAPVREFREATALGITARPVLVGPFTFLKLAKPAPGAPAGFRPLDRLDDLLDCYQTLLADLNAAGAGWVQLDEPALVGDLTVDELDAARRAYHRLGAATARPKLLVATYFGAPYQGRAGDALALLRDAPIDGVALDLVAGPRSADRLAALGGLGDRVLHAGVVDGRNVWRADLCATLATCATLLPLAGELVVSTSCSLLHVPVDLDRETDLDARVTGRLAFARQKVGEVVTIATALSEGTAAVGDPLRDADVLARSRAGSEGINNPAVRARLAGLTPADMHRATPVGVRAAAQQACLGLPPLPTTTIGSFPQTAEVRRARAQLRSGAITADEYTDRMRDAIDHAVAVQESIGLDVLVHGEPERNDMVQYFAEHLDGYAVTAHGWVQSYASRCVRPPILYGDVCRPEPMTVDWASYAQSRTAKPVKGMLTGPVTMLKWSFVRDDQPLADTAYQVALALRDEIAELEAAGIGIVQVDEPALREGLPLRAADQPAYLEWAVNAFRLATAGVADHTQIHTHMCYSEFGEVIGAIADLDADVTSVEAARSHMEIITDLADAGFVAAIGPGVYDIHSPRIPASEEIEKLLRQALTGVDPGRLWVNPDCGLKTRGYAEVEPALRAMLTATRTLRAELTQH